MRRARGFYKRDASLCVVVAIRCCSGRRGVRPVPAAVSPPARPLHDLIASFGGVGRGTPVGVSSPAIVGNVGRPGLGQRAATPRAPPSISALVTRASATDGVRSEPATPEWRVNGDEYADEDPAANADGCGGAEHDEVDAVGAPLAAEPTAPSAVLERLRRAAPTLPSRVNAAAFASVVAHAARHPICAVAAPAGTGKSSLVPLLLALGGASATRDASGGGRASEAAAQRPPRVWVSQPTRLGAVRLAHHVASLLGERVGQRVGYATGGRDTCFGAETVVVYATPGYIASFLAADGETSLVEGTEECDRIRAFNALRRVTHLVVDEAHVRGTHDDFLVAWARLQLAANNRGCCARSGGSDLRSLVLMSATLDVAALTHHASGGSFLAPEAVFDVFPQLSSALPLLDAPARLLTGHAPLFPVRVFFLDDLSGPDAALSGLSHSSRAALASAFSRTAHVLRDGFAPEAFAALGAAAVSAVFRAVDEQRRVSGAGAAAAPGMAESSVLVFLPGWAEILGTLAALAAHQGVVLVAGSDGGGDSDPLAAGTGVVRFVAVTVHGRIRFDVVLLHGSEGPMDPVQALATSDAPIRVVLATNVAESSVTVPGVSLVLDCALERHRASMRESPDGASSVEPDKDGGSSSGSAPAVPALALRLCAQGNLAQRRGRAGRTRPGVAVHLVARAAAAEQPAASPPQVLIEGAERALLMARLLLPRVPFCDLCRMLPTPIAPHEQRAALAALVRAHCAEAAETAPSAARHEGGVGTPPLTGLGRCVAALPLSTPLATFVVAALHAGCVVDAVLVAAAIECPASILRRPSTAREVTAFVDVFSALAGGEASEVTVLHSVMAAWVASGGVDGNAEAAPTSPSTWRRFARESALRMASAAAATVCDRLRHELQRHDAAWKDECWLLAQLGGLCAAASTTTPAASARGKRGTRTTLTAPALSSLLCSRRGRLLSVFAAAFGDTVLLPSVADNVGLHRAAAFGAATVDPERGVAGLSLPFALPPGCRSVGAEFFERRIATPLRAALPDIGELSCATSVATLVAPRSRHGDARVGALFLTLAPLLAPGGAGDSADKNLLEPTPLTSSLEFRRPWLRLPHPPPSGPSFPLEPLRFERDTMRLLLATQLFLRDGGVDRVFGAARRRGSCVSLVVDGDVPPETATDRSESDAAADEGSADASAVRFREAVASEPEDSANGSTGRTEGRRAGGATWAFVSRRTDGTRASLAQILDDAASFDLAVFDNEGNEGFAATVQTIVALGLADHLPQPVTPQPSTAQAIDADVATDEPNGDAAEAVAVELLPTRAAPSSLVLSGVRSRLLQTLACGDTATALPFAAADAVPLGLAESPEPTRSVAAATTDASEVASTRPPRSSRLLLSLSPIPSRRLSWCTGDAGRGVSGNNCRWCEVCGKAVLRGVGARSSPLDDDWGAHCRNTKHVVALIAAARHRPIIPAASSLGAAAGFACPTQRWVALSLRSPLQFLSVTGMLSRTDPFVAVPGVFAVCNTLSASSRGTGALPTAQTPWIVTPQTLRSGLAGLVASAARNGRPVLVLASRTTVRAVAFPHVVCLVLPAPLGTREVRALQAVARWSAQLPSTALSRSVVAGLRASLLALEDGLGKSPEAGAPSEVAELQGSAAHGDDFAWMPLQLFASSEARAPPLALTAVAATAEAAVLSELLFLSHVLRKSSVYLSVFVARVCRRLRRGEGHARVEKGVAASERHGRTEPADAPPSATVKASGAALDLRRDCEDAERHALAKVALATLVAERGFASLVDLLAAIGCVFRSAGDLVLVIPTAVPTAVPLHDVLASIPW